MVVRRTVVTADHDEFEREKLMTNTNSIEVSLTIAESAHTIFEILASPQRHHEFDGSDMLRGTVVSSRLREVGDTFTMKMLRLGRDYIMVNHVVEFEEDRRIIWAPAPGDLDTAGGDPARIGVPAGYRWGYTLIPHNDESTEVKELFDCGTEANRWILERDGGSWINGSSTIVDNMTATLARLAALCGRDGKP